MLASMPSRFCHHTRPTFTAHTSIYVVDKDIGSFAYGLFRYGREDFRAAYRPSIYPEGHKRALPGYSATATYDLRVIARGLSQMGDAWLIYIEARLMFEAAASARHVVDKHF